MAVTEVWVQETPKVLAVGESRSFTIDFANVGTPSAVNSITAYDGTGVDGNRGYPERGE